MKTKIIELLNTKNDKKENIFNFSPSIIPTTPWKHSSNEDMRYYLWLCQLQKWVREFYNWNIIIFNDDGDLEYKNLRYNYELRYILPSFKVKDKKSICGDYMCSTYNEALESGIYQILTILIRNNGRNNQ